MDKATAEAKAARLLWAIENVDVEFAISGSRGPLKPVDKKIAIIAAALEEAAADTRRHQFWGAGEPDCPRDIKAPNGELHTLRCKRCGVDNPHDTVCRPACGHTFRFPHGTQIFKCALRDSHVGPHAGMGCTWNQGSYDYSPANGKDE
jgi:hypothetical protein